MLFLSQPLGVGMSPVIENAQDKELTVRRLLIQRYRNWLDEPHHR